MLKKSLLAGLALGLALVTTALAADPIKIVYIGKNTGNPYFDSITGGFQDACKAKGCEFEFVAPATAEATSQIPFIEAQIQRGVNVIGIAPNSPDALNQVLDEAKAKGILVLTVNGDLVGNESHRAATILPVDFTKTGPNQVELMGSLIGYKGEIAILSATTEAPDQNTWIAAMKKTLAEDAKYKDMKLVATVYGDDQPEKSTTEMEALLSNYPNLVGVIAPTT
jgi:rhamnose transport system substrate-binding protein